MSIESVMPSNRFILCHPLFLPSIFPSIRDFPNELALCIRWPKYWSFSFSISLPMNIPILYSFKTHVLYVNAQKKIWMYTHQTEHSPVERSRCVEVWNYDFHYFVLFCFFMMKIVDYKIYHLYNFLKYRENGI